jgi:2-alkenal reductase
MKTYIKRLSTIVVLGLLVLGLTGCLFCGLPVFGRSSPTPSPVWERVQAQPTPAPAIVVQAVAAGEQTLIAIYKRVSPAVVNVYVTKRVDAGDLELPAIPDTPQGPDEFYEDGTGSGFVIDKEGHIVTNNHVVEGAEEVQVTFQDGTIVYAKVIGTDPDSDLAVIKVDVLAGTLVPVELGNSDLVQVGQDAIALGNPFGLHGTLTTGIVSALGRSLPLGRASEVVGSRFTIPDLIQTDAAINPGNSGGPLLDSQGRVIGVNTAYDPNVSGAGFAVPVNTVTRVLPKLISDGRYAYPWLGISGTDLSLEIIEEMKLSVNRGAIVLSVTDGSPADKAGLLGSTGTVQRKGREFGIGGDIIIAIDGQKVEKFEDILIYILRKTEVGQEITLTILRDGREQSVKVKLVERPK